MDFNEFLTKRLVKQAVDDGYTQTPTIMTSVSTTVTQVQGDSARVYSLRPIGIPFAYMTGRFTVGTTDAQGILFQYDGPLPAYSGDQLVQVFSATPSPATGQWDVYNLTMNIMGAPASPYVLISLPSPNILPLGRTYQFNWTYLTQSTELV